MARKLITDAILKATPRMGGTSDLDMSEVIVQAKFFTPWSDWVWFMVEYDPTTRIAFGFVASEIFPDGQIGYFSVAELEQARGPGGRRIERDEQFGRHTLQEVIAIIQRANRQ